MDDEKLICLVQKYTEIYDCSDSAYHNQQQKDNIWEEIAGEMKRPVAECKKRWGTLRDSYRKSLRSQRTKSGESGKKKKTWRYNKQMYFLRVFLVDRQQISNVSSSEDEITQEQEEYSHATDDASPNTISGGPSTSRPCSSVSIASQIPAQKGHYIKQVNKKTTSSAEVLQEYLKEKESRKRTSLKTPSDSITKFFECMAETVKTLSPNLQIEVKSKIFSIVSDAEIKNLNFSPISQTTTLIANQPSETNFHQQNWVTMLQPHFPQPQTQHSPAIPPKSYSQLVSSYSQQHIPEFTSVLPSTSFTEIIPDKNNEETH